MKAVAMFIALFLCLQLFTFTTATNIDFQLQQTDPRGVDIFRVEVDKNPFGIPRHTTEEFFEELHKIISTILAETCNVPVNYKLHGYTSRDFTWLIWYGGADDAEKYQVCSTKFFAEQQTIRTTAINNERIKSLGLVIQRAFDAQPSTRPNHCFNGVKDSGELNTDCGSEACDIKCQEKLTCKVNADCVQECFAQVCQYVSGSINIGYHTAIFAAVVGVLVMLF